MLPLENCIRPLESGNYFYVLRGFRWHEMRSLIEHLQCQHFLGEEPQTLH